MAREMMAANDQWTAVGALATLDPRQETAREIGERLEQVATLIDDLDDVDELDQVEAWLLAVAKRLDQLDAESSEAHRLRVRAYRRIGELLGAPVYGRNNPNGVNQYAGEDKSQPRDLSSTLDGSAKNRRYHARLIDRHWDLVAPRLPTMKRPTIAAVLREIGRLTAKLDPIPDGGEAVVALASWEEWLGEQSSCDALLTDPPYSTEVEDVAAFAAGWLPPALAKVKPTGRAYVCIGAYPLELAAYLAVPPPNGLVLSQVLVWTYRNTLGPRPSHDYKLNWQAVLYYRGWEAPELASPEMVEQFSVQDINAPDGRLGDRWHAWQKPDELAERFVRHATRPGDLILDPFAGTGTFLLAAARLGRRGYGCEPDPEMIALCEARGLEVRRAG
jgi:DNA methylase